MSYLRQKGSTCDICGSMNAAMRLRYKCLICIDCSLCGGCQDKGLRTATHLSTHPMQCIIPTTMRELFFGGEETRSSALPTQSFTCPHCGELGFSLRTLLDHVGNRHLAETTEVLCPICVCEDAMRNVNAHHVTDNLALHLVLKHGTRSTYLREVMKRNTRLIGHSLEMSPTPIAQETPIGSMVRMMSQTLLDMRTISPQEAKPHDDENDDVSSASSEVIARHRLIYRTGRPISNETTSNRNTMHSLPVELKSANAETLYTMKKKIESFERQSASITEIGSNDCAQRFLLPTLQRNELCILELRTNLWELWYRAEFVQALLTSMLSLNDLRETTKVSVTPVKCSLEYAQTNIRRIEETKRTREKQEIRRRNTRTFVSTLEPCIQEDTEEDTDEQLDNTEL